NGGERGGSGVQVVEHTEALGGGQIDPGLLARLADRRDEEVGVGGVVTAARQRDLTGPGIVGALGATDQQRLEPPRPLEEDQGYRGGARPGRGLRLGAEVLPREPPG